MYCKHCGKLIDDDSTFCKHCGKSQDVNPISNASNVQKTSNKEQSAILKSINNMSEKEKKWARIYLIWVLVNFTCMFIHGFHSSSSNYFYPFQYRYGWAKRWDLEYYDFSEFLVYAIILPLIAFYLYKYRDNIIKWYKKNKKLS